MPAAKKPLRRPLVMAAVIAGMFTIAIEATIVATAMPQIASQLGDLHLYAWVFSAFLLTQTATTVVFGKLADIYGRKPMILIGMGIFLLGSTLCGLAWSMPSLIAFRLLQGTGAGAIQPVCLTIVGDMYEAEERGKIQGYLASVWGITAVLGPLVGGLIIQHFHWAWIFWINIPVGLAACVGFIAYLHETRPNSIRQVDVAGAILFSIAVASLMVAFTEIGTSTRTTAIAAGIFVVSTALFAVQERRAADPMLELALWARRPIATANAVVLFASMAIIGLTAFLPIYVQVVLNRSALAAGFTLTMLVLGWPIGTTLAARNFSRFGLRRTLLCGAALLPAGAMVFPLLGPGASPVFAAVGSAVMGFGMGLLSVSAIVIIQESTALHERGVATASNMFARNLGSTLGAVVLGGVLNTGLAYFAAEKIDFDQVRHLLDHPGSVIGGSAVRAALAGALHLTFAAMFLVAVLTLLLAILVPAVSMRRAAQVMAAD
jgi:EmrB/QacA subfamily drug resistance transporter